MSCQLAVPRRLPEYSLDLLLRYGEQKRRFQVLRHGIDQRPERFLERVERRSDAVKVRLGDCEAVCECDFLPVFHGFLDLMTRCLYPDALAQEVRALVGRQTQPSADRLELSALGRHSQGIKPFLPCSSLFHAVSLPACPGRPASR